MLDISLAPCAACLASVRRWAFMWCPCRDSFPSVCVCVVGSSVVILFYGVRVVTEPAGSLTTPLWEVGVEIPMHGLGLLCFVELSPV